MSQYDESIWARKARQTDAATGRGLGGPDYRRTRVPEGVTVRRILDDHPELADVRPEQWSQAMEHWVARQVKDDPRHVAVYEATTRELGYDVDPSTGRAMPSQRGHAPRVDESDFLRSWDSWWSVYRHKLENFDGDSGAPPDPDFDQHAIAMAAAGLGPVNVLASHHSRHNQALGPETAERFRQAAREVGRVGRKSMDWGDGDDSQDGGAAEAAEWSEQELAALRTRGIDPEPEEFPERPLTWQESGEITDQVVQGMSLEEFREFFDERTNQLRPEKLSEGYAYSPTRGQRIRR